MNDDKENKKARDGFLESARVIELLDVKEMEGLAETMFKGERKHNLLAPSMCTPYTCC